MARFVSRSLPCRVSCRFWYDAHLATMKLAKEAPVSESQLAGDHVERLGGFSTIRAGAGVNQWNGAHYAMGLSEQTVGSHILSMNVARLAAGGTIEAHIHDGYEVGLYVLEGRLEHRFGPGLTQSLVNGPGDFIFVEPGVPHAAFNLSDTDPVVVVVARTSAAEWARAIPYDPAQERDARST